MVIDRFSLKAQPRCFTVLRDVYCFELRTVHSTALNLGPMHYPVTCHVEHSVHPPGQQQAHGKCSFREYPRSVQCTVCFGEWWLID